MGFLFGQQAIETKPKSPPITNNQKWKALAPFVKKHFDTGNKTNKEIAADLALAHYYQEKKKWKKFSEEIG